MKSYLKRLVELVGVTFVGGAVAYVQLNGFELSRAAVSGAVTAGAVAVYGVLVKAYGDKDRPTAK